jgi:hypothetical protein
MGACICLFIALGIAAGGQLARDSVTAKTMQACAEHKRTLGEIIFSDYTKQRGTILETWRLQVATLVRALFKILAVYLSIGLLNRVTMVVLGALIVVPGLVPIPVNELS